MLWEGAKFSYRFINMDHSEVQYNSYMLRYTMLAYITLLCYVMLRYITWHCNVTLRCYVTLCCYVALLRCCGTLRHVTLCYSMLCCFMLRYTMLCCYAMLSYIVTLRSYIKLLPFVLLRYVSLFYANWLAVKCFVDLNKCYINKLLPTCFHIDIYLKNI